MSGEESKRTQTLAAIVTQESGVVPLKAPVGAVLFRPGDPCPGFVVLDGGVIKVSMVSASGREIVLYRVRPGEICLQTFSCLIDAQTYGAEGVVEEAASGFLVQPPAFERLMAAHGGFRQAVFHAVASRFASFEEVVEALAFSGLEQRVASALLRRADAGDVVHATHEALAAEIGSAREAVSRQLAVFVRQGLVSLARGQVRIERRDALAQAAQTPA